MAFLWGCGTSSVQLSDSLPVPAVRGRDKSVQHQFGLLRKQIPVLDKKLFAYLVELHITFSGHKCEEVRTPFLA